GCGAGRSRRRRRPVRVDGVVGLEDRPPGLVYRVLVDLVLLVEFVDEPFIGSELSFVRYTDARHLARHARSPAFVKKMWMPGPQRPSGTILKRNPVRVALRRGCAPWESTIRQRHPRPFQSLPLTDMEFYGDRP